MKRITAALYEFGEYKAVEIQHNPYPSINTLYRVHKEGASHSGRPGHRILCHDPSRQPQHVIDINAAWLKLPNAQKDCVYGKYVVTQLVNEDGQPYTAAQVAQILEMSVDTFNRNVSRGRQVIESNVVL